MFWVFALLYEILHTNKVQIMLWVKVLGVLLDEVFQPFDSWIHIQHIIQLIFYFLHYFTNNIWLKGIRTKPAPPEWIWEKVVTENHIPNNPPISDVSGRMSPSWQWLHFKAETFVPNSVTSQQREHLVIKCSGYISTGAKDKNYNCNNTEVHEWWGSFNQMNIY